MARQAAEKREKQLPAQRQVRMCGWCVLPHACDLVWYKAARVCRSRAQAHTQAVGQTACLSVSVFFIPLPPPLSLSNAGPECVSLCLSDLLQTQRCRQGSRIVSFGSHRQMTHSSWSSSSSCPKISCVEYAALFVTTT